ncbi:RNA polymerase sigma-70 factor (ECF subfamily) [Pedobacter sp. CG_S7]|uniref:RNA polymerase sigma-70 factor n=1 Tax=Pedobacter sp. CG_S7 TaxID=3143930 RepID=UPI00339ADB39
MHKKDLSDKFLLEQIHLNGDNLSLKLLFNRYFQPLCRFAYPYVKNHSIAEELVSDTFCSIWFNRSKLNLPDKTRPYLYKAVRNHAINHLQKKKPLYTDLSYAENLPFTGSDPEEILSYNELLSEVNLLIDSLPERKKMIFRMSKMEGLKYKEIAEILGISSHTVQNHMVEAIKIMAEKAHQHSRLFLAFSLLILS